MGSGEGSGTGSGGLAEGADIESNPVGSMEEQEPVPPLGVADVALEDLGGEDVEAQTASTAPIGLTMSTEPTIGGNVHPQEIDYLYTDEAKAERIERLKRMAEAQEMRDFLWLQEEAEDEANKGEYWTSGGTLFDYQEMSIQFGYVTLFSMGFTICPLIAYINNRIELRTDSFKINGTLQRPFYRVLPGIGMWSDVLYFMVVQAIFVNMLHIVIYDASDTEFDLFDTSNMQATVIVLIVAEHIIVGLKIVAENAIPDESIWLETAKNGYEYLEKACMENVGAEAAAAMEDLENLRSKILKHYGEAGKDVEDRFAEVGTLKRALE
jgi:hypothetical protein